MVSLNRAEIDRETTLCKGGMSAFSIEMYSVLSFVEEGSDYHSYPSATTVVPCMSHILDDSQMMNIGMIEMEYNK